MSKIQIICFFFLSGFAALPLLKAESLPSKFIPTSEIQHASDADYIFLKDEDSREWIYKQVTDPSPDDQIVIVLEILASQIAQALSIPLNYVELIPPTADFEYRLFPNYPGSLHLRVPGKCAEEELPWTGFDLHQKIRSPFLIARKGPLPPNEVGLRRAVIENMAKHPDLAKIAALDTYLGNSDRSHPNIFYDRSTDSFYGIDMGSCLIGNLAQAALEKIPQYSPFSKAELTALKRYRETLVALLSQFPLTEILSLFSQELREAGFVPENERLWNEDVERKLEKWKRLLEESHQSSKKLVQLLSEIHES